MHIHDWRTGKLLRIYQGISMRPIKTRFGKVLPRISLVLNELPALCGETILPTGGAAAYYLGRATQNPARLNCLTP